MILKDYMNEKFPDLELKPALFYNWETGIRFELGVDYDVKYAYTNSPYLRGVYNRVNGLFHSLFSQDDEIFVVVNVDDYGDNSILKHKLKVFLRT